MRGEDYRPLTADFAYVRWLGSREIQEFSRVVIDRSEELDHWAEWIRSESERLREIYGFFNNHYSGHAPASARDLLARKGYDPAYGARPLKRAIQKYIENPLSMEILKGSVKDGDVVTLDATGDGIGFSVETAE